MTSSPFLRIPELNTVKYCVIVSKSRKLWPVNMTDTRNEDTTLDELKICLRDTTSRDPPTDTEFYSIFTWQITFSSQ